MKTRTKLTNCTKSLFSAGLLLNSPNRQEPLERNAPIRTCARELAVDCARML